MDTEKLRELADDVRDIDTPTAEVTRALNDAADEIDRLREKLARLGTVQRPSDLRAAKEATWSRVADALMGR